ncbi:uncharacterized protein VTP21DRAFT_9206 [Calcarisporiella thermophila]|uniref:uncharacterized protein n=1 Tax=Calcarisporiella thermophila TaxID=911321 RepID=UPI003741FF85
MSLKYELEQWQQALAQFESKQYEKAIDTFKTIADTARINFNIGMVFANICDQREAIYWFDKAVEIDKFFAISYYQRGVSNFLLGELADAERDFDLSLKNLRGNQLIDYTQLGLNHKLFACEILFNRGLCRIYSGRTDSGVDDLKYASTQKRMKNHDVIDDAIETGGKGFTVFSIPPGVLYRPLDFKLKNSKMMEYFGTSKPPNKAEMNTAESDSSILQTMDSYRREDLDFSYNNSDLSYLSSVSSQKHDRSFNEPSNTTYTSGGSHNTLGSPKSPSAQQIQPKWPNSTSTKIQAAPPLPSGEKSRPEGPIGLSDLAPTFANSMRLTDDERFSNDRPYANDSFENRKYINNGNNARAPDRKEYHGEPRNQYDEYSLSYPFEDENSLSTNASQNHYGSRNDRSFTDHHPTMTSDMHPVLVSKQDGHPPQPFSPREEPASSRRYPDSSPLLAGDGQAPVVELQRSRTLDYFAQGRSRQNNHGLLPRSPQGYSQGWAPSQASGFPRQLNELAEQSSREPFPSLQRSATTASPNFAHGRVGALKRSGTDPSFKGRKPMVDVARQDSIRSPKLINKIKIKCHPVSAPDDTRVLLMDKQLTFTDLLRQVKDKFGVASTPLLKYRDEDNELVMMMDDDDLMVARMLVEAETGGEVGMEKLDIWVF